MTRADTQHHFNSLHLYCRLRDLGVSKRYARWMCQHLELVLRTLLYKPEKEEENRDTRRNRRGTHIARKV